MKMINILILTIIGGLFFAAEIASRTSANAQTDNRKRAVENAPSKCSVEAYRRGTADDALKTTVIYSRPSVKSAIVETVTTTFEVVYTISGSDNNGWFEISKITEVEENDGVLFEGRGWIPASLLDLSVAAGDPNLRAAPNKRSRVVKKLIADASEARPLACAGDWMRIKSGKFVGWLAPEGQCANPLTTCP